MSCRHPTELHLFITMGWSLCARLDTSSSVHIHHVDWHDDCMLVGVGKSKKNYLEKVQHYRVYGNPFMPKVCPVLSMAIHCACNTLICSQPPHGLPLFHDGGAPDLSSDFGDAMEACNICGCGTHSIRKGNSMLK